MPSALRAHHTCSVRQRSLISWWTASVHSQSVTDMYVFVDSSALYKSHPLLFPVLYSLPRHVSAHHTDDKQSSIRNTVIDLSFGITTCFNITQVPLFRKKDPIPAYLASSLRRKRLIRSITTHGYWVKYINAHFATSIISASGRLDLRSISPRSTTRLGRRRWRWQRRHFQ